MLRDRPADALARRSDLSSLLLPPSHQAGVRRDPTARQKYECSACRRRFDDLTGTIFAGHHRPLRIWILCLYLMGLNLSKEQIAQQLDFNGDDVQKMASQLRVGIVERSRR